MEERENFAREMTILKEELKDQINWDQVHLVISVGYFVYDKRGILSLVLLKGKKLRNPAENRWKITNNGIATDGLKANSNVRGWRSISVEKGFAISVDFPGPILYYFEVNN